MNTDITQEQIEAYQAQGCLVLPDFLTPGELEELRAAVSMCSFTSWATAGMS